MAQVISVTPEGSKERVIFTVTLGGNTLGPYVKDRPAGADHAAWVASKEAEALAQAKAREINSNIAKVLDTTESNPQFSLVFSTVTENGLALREVYKESAGANAYRIGWFVHNLNWTNQQLINRFGLTAQNVAAAKTKLANLAAAYESMIAAAGE